MSNNVEEGGRGLENKKKHLTFLSLHSPLHLYLKGKIKMNIVKQLYRLSKKCSRFQFVKKKLFQFYTLKCSQLLSIQVNAALVFTHHYKNDTNSFSYSTRLEMYMYCVNMKMVCKAKGTIKYAFTMAEYRVSPQD